MPTKPAPFPAIRVEPELHDAAAFIRRGLASRDEARHSGRYVSAAAVLRKLEAKLKKAQSANPRRTRRA